jgi:Transposase DDE domain group 1
MRTDQLRPWFVSLAYVLICALCHGSSPWAEGPRIGLKHTHFARASCGTIRLKLLRIGATVRTALRRVKFAIPSAFPHQAKYHTAHAALTAARPDTNRNTPSKYLADYPGTILPTTTRKG